MKETIRKRLKKQTREKGITLMVLVITIIVLLILASVTVNLIWGDRGIVGEAKEASNEWDKATEGEQSDLSELAQKIKNSRNGIYNGTLGGEEENKIENQTGSNEIGGSEIKNEVTGGSEGGGDEEKDPSDGMSVANVKKVVNEDNIREYIGTKVDYNPLAGGTWRIFYYDKDGEFGPSNTVYLKRDYDELRVMYDEDAITTYPASTDGIEIMKRMNPKWRDYPTENANVINTVNEHIVSYLCDSLLWNIYKTENSSFAIASPSVEMYMKAFNLWKTGNKDATNLVCKVIDGSGYSVGANNSYSNASGKATAHNTIEAGPNSIFLTSGKSWWLSSPSTANVGNLIYVYGPSNYNYVSNTRGARAGICPIVPLDL